MKQSVVYIGIDVAKAHLDVAWAGVTRRFANDQKGRAALVNWIKGSSSAAAAQLICGENGGRSSLLTPVMRERVPVNCCRISQNFSPAGVTSPFVAWAMPTRSSDERLRKYANLAAAAAPCSSLNFAHRSRSDY